VPVTAVVGGHWGDEGKGKVINLLARDADLVIRGHGGANAGHTVVNEQGRFAVHLIPAGIFNPRALCIIGPGVAVHPGLLVAELDELLIDTSSSEGEIDGHVRIKSPTTITSVYLGALFSEFQFNNPRVTLEVVLMDRSVNPLEENYDLVVGARAASYPNVVDIPLCTYPQTLCCAPAYLRTKPEPRHPGDLIDHDCLTTVLFGTTWPFETPRGAVSVEVRSRFHANDGRVILEGVRRGLGVAILPRYLVDEDLKVGRLVPVLDAFPLATYWLKALVPRIKMDRPAVRELVAFLKARTQSAPPWPI